jgi:hypothetical protein
MANPISITGLNLDEIKKAAAEQVTKERTDRAKTAYIKQLRVVESAKEALKAEEMKLADIEQQILDGTI